jgi:hypothetical protein
MKLLFVAVVIALFVSGCAEHADPGDSVQDESAAIDIGRNACAGGSLEVFFNNNPRYRWHARLSGDNWIVWEGPREDGIPLYEISIAKHDGKPADCGLWVR